MQRLKRYLWLGMIGVVGGVGLSVVVVHAAASYPGAVKSFTTKTDGPGQTIFAAHINDLQDEIVAIEQSIINGPLVIKGRSYSWPSGAGAAGTVLTNNGSDTLAWSATAVARGCDVRATLTSGTPITTTDVTGAATVYVTPYVASGGGPAYCAFYDGSSTWSPVAVTEVPIALGTLSSGLPYDLFCYNNAGAMGCDAPVAWSSGTARSIALALQNGVYVKSGATTRRYVATFYTTSTTTTEDSFAKRLLWNYYNRVPRVLRRLETTATWPYTTATYQQANASASNQVEAVMGVAEVPLQLQLLATGANSVGGVSLNVSIGEDSTTTADTAVSGGYNNAAGSNANYQLIATLVKYPAAGYHKWVWLEKSSASGTTTWVGTTNTANSGLTGRIEG